MTPTSPTGFPPGTVYAITDISNAIPAVVTLGSFNLLGSFYIVNGMVLTISGVKGLTQLNGQRFTIGNVDMDELTFSLYDAYYKPVDTTSYPSYVSGGQINIISYVAQAGMPPGLMYNTQPITV